MLVKVRPDWTQDERAHHLSSFLFLHHNSHHQPVYSLSEGEKARLSLAVIAAHSPDILLLDEVTNNLDIRTKEHLINVLNAYPGTLIVNSHETQFLEAISLHRHWCLA
jgi:ATPase subunit of ABC transporter with duplicated ATPase domains